MRSLPEVDALAERVKARSGQSCSAAGHHYVVADLAFSSAQGISNQKCLAQYGRFLQLPKYELCKQSLLSMQAILCLVEDDGLRPVDDLSCLFLTAHCGQAIQEGSTRGSFGHEVCGNLERQKCFETFVPGLP